MFSMHESIKFRESKSYNTEKNLLKSCSILDFNSKYYRPEISKLYFFLPHVYILGKNHCEDKHHYMFVIQQNKWTVNSHVIMQKDVRY